MRQWIESTGNGLSPLRCVVINLTNDDILCIGPLGTNAKEIVIKIRSFTLTYMHLLISVKGIHLVFAYLTGIILAMVSASERGCYNVTPSLIGRAHTQNDPRMC